MVSESAATLEAESGYRMESPQVAHFRRCILEGNWSEAEASLSGLGHRGKARSYMTASTTVTRGHI